MKRAAISILLMAAGLSWPARAQDKPAAMAGGKALEAAAAAATATDAAASTAAPAVLPDVPYATIIARNMFGLVPIPKVDPDAGKPPPEEPPKITLTGIMTIFNKEQAIFKVANKAKPGQQPKEDSCVLAEGDMQDEITVVKINHVEGIVTFNNHGTVQDVSLVPAKEGGPGGGPGGGGPGGPGAGNRAAALARFNVMNPQAGGGGFAGFQARTANAGSPQPGMGGGAANVGNNGITMLGDTPVNANRIYSPQADPSPLAPEQQALLIETQRKIYEQQGNPLSRALPPSLNGPAARQLLDQLDNQ